MLGVLELGSEYTNPKRLTSILNPVITVIQDLVGCGADYPHFVINSREALRRGSLDPLGLLWQRRIYKRGV